MKTKALRRAALALAAAMLLGSCNFGPGAGEEAPTLSPLPQLAVSAKPYEGPEEGSYFNLEVDCGLYLDGEGGFRFTSAEAFAEGTYTATESEIIFVCGGEEARGFFSGDGISLSGVRGIFLPAEEGDFASLGFVADFDREYEQRPDGVRSLSDFGLQLGLEYPDAMSAEENLIADAVVIYDGDRGFVTGRNVTDAFAADAKGEDFMETYMAERIPADFRMLYGVDAAVETSALLDEGVAGRIASAEAVLTGGEERIYVKCIMYTSTSADGTVNYICKSFFAPEGDPKAFNALANGVVNMTAVRRK